MKKRGREKVMQKKSLTTSHRRSMAIQTATLENKSTLLPLPEFLFLSETLAQSNQLSWLCSLSISCPLPAYSTRQSREREKKERECLSTTNHCSVVAQALLYYQHWFNHKSKTQQHTSQLQYNLLTQRHCLQGLQALH